MIAVQGKLGAIRGQHPGSNGQAQLVLEDDACYRVFGRVGEGQSDIFQL